VLWQVCTIIWKEQELPRRQAYISSWSDEKNLAEYSDDVLKVCWSTVGRLFTASRYRNEFLFCRLDCRYHSGWLFKQCVHFLCNKDGLTGVRDLFGTMMGVQHCLGASAGVQHCLGASAGVQHCLGASAGVQQCLRASAGVQQCFGASTGVQHCLGASAGVQQCFGASPGFVSDCRQLIGRWYHCTAPYIGRALYTGSCRRIWALS
jgi:hypothetical protein